MHHEVLLALLGYGGNVIRDMTPDWSVETDTGDDSKGFAVSEAFPYLQDAEKAIISRLCVLGCQYTRLDIWVRSQQTAFGRAALAGHDTNADSEWGHSVFVPAAAEGVKEVLDAYREDIVKCEKLILKEPSLPLAHLVHALSYYEVVFPVLRDLCRTIVVSKSKGAHLLDVIRKMSLSGVPDIRTLMLRILYHCHRALFKMLESWMCHGHLLDPFGDFFLKAGDAKKEEEESDIKLWSERYVLVPSEIPNYIPSITAQHILFVGKAVQLLKHPKAANIFGKDRNNAELDDDTQEFSRVLQTLASSTEFRPLSFEVEMEKMRATAARHLWLLVVEDCALMKHLESLKAFFLCGKGELWASFIEESRGFFAVPPTSQRQAEHDLNTLFRTSLSKCLPDDDDQSDHFWLSYSEGCWTGLQLGYNVQWPLDLIVGQSVLSKYQKLFAMIFRTRRAEMELREAWALLMLSSRRCHSTVRSQLMCAWTLRAQMAFLVENLMHYVQEDVIAVQWNKLTKKVSDSTDFGNVWKAHDAYLTSLSSLCFLHTQTVSSAISGVLDLCFDFAAATQVGLASVSSQYEEAAIGGQGVESGQMARTAVKELVDYLGQVSELDKEFSKRSKFLLAVLSGVQSHESANAISQLLLRFGSNDHFSS